MFKPRRKLRQSRAHSTRNWTVCILRFPGCLTSSRVLKKGKFPSQTQQNPKGMHEISSASDPNARIDEVKVVVTLRSGKELRSAVPAPTKTAPTIVDPPEEEQLAAREEVKPKVPPPPFPQALQKKKNSFNQTEILEVLQQVKVNIPLLDMIKQVPT